MKTLIIELFNAGHYPEYIRHLLEGLSKGTGESKGEYIFLFSQNFRNNFQKYCNNKGNFSIIFLNDLEQKHFESKTGGRKLASFFWELIEEKQKEWLFNHVFFMNINLVLRSRKSFNLFYRSSCTFSGIFFQSPFNLRSFGWRKLFKCKKREMVLRLLARNRSCTGVYLLNDLAGSRYYQKWSNKFDFIPDPINPTPPSKLNIVKYHGLLETQVVFLHIGNLGKYKGSFELLKAIFQLPKSKAAMMRFLFVGKMDNQLIEQINRANTFFDESVITMRNEYITDEDFSAYVEQCHVVVIANKNIETSSGVVNHSLQRKKVIIAPNYGYFKERLDSYKGAILFDEASSLKTCLIKAYDGYSYLQNGAECFDVSEFIDINSPENFFAICTQKVSASYE